MGARLTINGAPDPQTTLQPLVSTNRFSASAIETRAAGDRITLELFGLAGTAVTLAGSQGAAVVIIRLS